LDDPSALFTEGDGVAMSADQMTGGDGRGHNSTGEASTVAFWNSRESRPRFDGRIQSDQDLLIENLILPNSLTLPLSRGCQSR
jgi:hypothetical protein